MTGKHSPILRDTHDRIEITPYTRRDRRITAAILVIAIINLLLMIITILVWGNPT